MYQAIFWHTTGKADMSLLDKILYMADYIEPNRDFEGVERLRKLAYTDLDQAMLLGVESTIEEMQQRGVLSIPTPNRRGLAASAGSNTRRLKTYERKERKYSKKKTFLQKGRLVGAA